MSFEIDFEMFKNIINSIQKDREDSEVLTKTLIRHSVGIVDYTSEIVGNLVYMLKNAMNDTGDLIDWWLYESVDKIVKVDNVAYDITDIKDLYHMLKGEYNKVKTYM